MDLQEWKKEYVDKYETPQDALKHVIANALLCAKRHHLECSEGEGVECAKTYIDLLNLLHSDEVQIDFE